MRIYIAHSTGFDYQLELYKPIRKSALNRKHAIVLPHENSDEPFNSRELFRKGCDLVIAEVSFPSTGQGIELGWADSLEIPIVCVYRKGSKPSGALRVVTNHFVEYADSKELISGIEKVMDHMFG